MKMTKVEVIIHHEIKLPIEVFNAIYDYRLSVCMTFDDTQKYQVNDRVKLIHHKIKGEKEKCVYMLITAVIRGEKYAVPHGCVMLSLTKINL